MPKEEQKNNIDKVNAVGSAPELPHHVAKQYDLHKDGVHPTEPTPGTTASKDDAPETGLTEEEQSSSVVVDDSKTEAAVDDILTKESDQLLAVQDNMAVPVYNGPKPKHRRGFWGSIGNFFAAWWRNKWARWITIIIIAATVVALGMWQKTRYAVLNTVGVRSSASVVVLDNTTQLPLKNVSVTLGKEKSLTNKEGKASFKNLKLGHYPLAIKRIAFAPVKQDITIGWGSNPLGSFKIKATGTQYVITVTDYVSGKPIAGAEANSDEANALSDKDGKITLTVEDTDVTKLDVTVGGKGYRTQALELDAESTATTTVVLVPSVKAVYISKQSGKYDLYSSDLDGQDKKLILPGTGLESSNIGVVVSPDGKRAALLSSRDNMRDDDGYLLQALTIIDLTDNTHVTVDHAEQLQFVDWIGNRLIYRTTLAGASASNPQRNRLISYNYESNARLQLATANQFNAIVSTHGFVYYTVSSTDPGAALGLFKVKVDGSGRKRLSEKEIWTAVRSGYDALALQTPDGWQQFTFSSEKFDQASQPSSLSTRSYIEESDSNRSIWTDNRDGKGVLLLHDNSKNTDKSLQTQEGLTSPVRWASDKVIIYRVASGSETADYAISPNGGTSRKIADVTATYGYAQIY